MISRVLKEDEIRGFRKLLSESEKIVITCHVSPDGDAIGSSLGLCLLLRKLGKDVSVITPDMPLLSLRHLTGWRDIIAYSKYTDFGTAKINDADLIFCLDYNSLYRIDRMKDAVADAKAKKIMIDHHLGPESFCDLIVSYPRMTSTCELLFHVICELGLFGEVDRECAECIYTGMMTDTGNFSYNSNVPDLYIMIAELLKKGIDKDRLYTLAMNTNSISRVKLMGYATSQKMEIFPENRVALITLTREELKRFDYQKGDTESLVNVPLSIPTVNWSVFLREDADYIKVSTRSKGEFEVNRVCENYFNGGGHKNAAGGEFYGTMDEAIATFKKVLEDLNKNNKHIHETNGNKK